MRDERTTKLGVEDPLELGHSFFAFLSFGLESGILLAEDLEGLLEKGEDASSGEVEQGRV